MCLPLTGWFYPLSLLPSYKNSDFAERFGSRGKSKDFDVCTVSFGALQRASRSACIAARMDLSPSVIAAAPRKKPHAIIARVWRSLSYRPRVFSAKEIAISAQFAFILKSLWRQLNNLYRIITRVNVRSSLRKNAIAIASHIPLDWNAESTSRPSHAMLIPTKIKVVQKTKCS